MVKITEKRENEFSSREYHFNYEVSQRLREYMKSRCLTATQFAYEINVGKSTLSNYFGGIGTAGTALQAVIHCPDLSPEWLFRGTGNMLVKDNVLAHTPTHEDIVTEQSTVSFDDPVVTQLLNRLEQQAVRIHQLEQELQQLQKTE